jgi:hypothetical protein
MHMSQIMQGNETRWPKDERFDDEMDKVRTMLKKKPWRKLDI